MDTLANSEDPDVMPLNAGYEYFMNTFRRSRLIMSTIYLYWTIHCRIFGNVYFEKRSIYFK